MTVQLLFHAQCSSWPRYYTSGEKTSGFYGNNKKKKQACKREPGPELTLGALFLGVEAQQNGWAPKLLGYCTAHAMLSCPPLRVLPTPFPLDPF